MCGFAFFLTFIHTHRDDRMASPDAIILYEKPAKINVRLLKKKKKKNMAERIRLNSRICIVMCTFCIEVCYKQIVQYGQR